MHNSVKDICLLVVFFLQHPVINFLSSHTQSIGFPHQSHSLTILNSPMSFSRMVTVLLKFTATCLNEGPRRNLFLFFNYHHFEVSSQEALHYFLPAKHCSLLKEFKFNYIKNRNIFLFSLNR